MRMLFRELNCLYNKPRNTRKVSIVMKKLGWIGVMVLIVWVVSAYSNALGMDLIP